MAQKTNLNASPYFDDFDTDNNYQRILFRPGFAIQARELTQLQSALQHQIESHGSHVFREGAMVVPGQGTTQSYYSLKLAGTFADETIDPSQYYNTTTPVIITGATNGVTAKVIGYKAATTTDQPLLYLSYIRSGTDFETSVFADGENISANIVIQHSTASYAIDTASVTTYTSAYSVAAGSSDDELSGSTGPASRTGTAYAIESGIYYVRGFFVNNLAETLVLDNYSEDYSGTVGFRITENIITPESNTELLDNSTGASNFAAKGAHRLSISVALTSTTDTPIVEKDFISLISIRGGNSLTLSRSTPYAALADEFARRTNDESGNYTTRPFTFTMDECIPINPEPTRFKGRYTVGDTTDDDNIANSSLLSLIVSPAKAYINGFEIEKTQISIKDLNKARNFDTFNAGISTFDAGNYALISNVYGSPDITSITGESTSFKTLQFYDTANSTRGAANGNLIGVGRARAIEYHSGVVGASSTNIESIYKLYLFDIRPFTNLTLSGTPSPTLLASHANGGVLVTGSNSGATGIVYASGTSGTSVNLTSIVGTFRNGETITASDSAETGGIVENSGNTDLTILDTSTKNFGNFRQVYMADADSGHDFTADFVTERDSTLAAVLLEESESRKDGVQLTEGEEVQDLEAPVAAKLQFPNKNRAVFKLPKKTVKTLLTATNSGASDTQYTIRRQFVGTSSSSGVVTFSAGSNETFGAHAEADYTMSILTAGDGTGSAGDIVSIASTLSGAGSTAITITDDTILGASAKVKLLATILKTSITQKSKTVNLMKQLKVTSGATDAYGTRPSDRAISLGRADVFRLLAVIDSEDASTDAVAPELTLTTQSGTFTRGEKITGGTSNATARIIDITSPMSYVRPTRLAFVSGETITGESSGATAVISALTDIVGVGITNKFLFDSGQRDNFYDISRIVRKTNAAAPTGRLLIIYDYMEHGTGDVLTVDSYTDVANQMNYKNIPRYSQFPLRDSYDFRPRVEDIAGTSSTLETIDEITGNSFDFYSRQYDGTGASTVDVCKPGSTIQSDFEYYLPRRSTAIINSRGVISILDGISAEVPQAPDLPVGVMKLAEIRVPAFTFSPSSVVVTRTRNQRFTMKDIGKIARRVTAVERMTTLNLLERNAASFEVTDANGLNRFKSGFMVDNFQGHKVGDAFHKDYRVAMNFQTGELRPPHITKSVDLEESVTTDAARTGAGYQKTGDLLTLPYTEVVLTEQPFASTVERVAPYMTATWKGVMEISPTQDNWMETEIAPELVLNVEGNYNAVIAAIGNNMGTVWNSWVTNWAGTVALDDGTVAEPKPVSVTAGGGGGDDNDDADGFDTAAGEDDYGIGEFGEFDGGFDTGESGYGGFDADGGWDGGDGDGGDGGKIICTAMNQMYGFGGFRNAVWLRYQKSNMMREEYELGYHKLFMPLVKKMPSNNYIRLFLERVAKNRTINLRKEMRGQKTDIEYRVFKYAIRPIFFAVGWLVKKKILSKTDI